MSELWMPSVQDQIRKKDKVFYLLTTMKKYKAYEVLTSITHAGISNRFLGRYIVVATSAARASLCLDLREGEGIVEIREMHHTLILPPEIAEKV